MVSGGAGGFSSRNRSRSPDAHRRLGRDEPTTPHTPGDGGSSTPPTAPRDVAPPWLLAGPPRGDLLRISHVMSLGGRPADQARALAALAVYAPGEEQRRLSATLAASAGAKVRRAALEARAVGDGGGRRGGGGGGGGVRPPSATTTDTAWVAAVATATAVAAPALDSVVGEAVTALAAAARAHLGDRLSRSRLNRVNALAPTAAWDAATGLGHLHAEGRGGGDGHPLAATMDYAGGGEDEEEWLEGGRGSWVDDHPLGGGDLFGTTDGEGRPGGGIATGNGGAAVGDLPPTPALDDALDAWRAVEEVLPPSLPLLARSVRPPGLNDLLGRLGPGFVVIDGAPDLEEELQKGRHPRAVTGSAGGAGGGGGGGGGAGSGGHGGASTGGRPLGVPVGGPAGGMSGLALRTKEAMSRVANERYAHARMVNSTPRRRDGKAVSSEEHLNMMLLSGSSRPTQPRTSVLAGGEDELPTAPNAVAAREAKRAAKQAAREAARLEANAARAAAAAERNARRQQAAERRSAATPKRVRTSCGATVITSASSSDTGGDDAPPTRPVRASVLVTSDDDDEANVRRRRRRRDDDAAPARGSGDRRRHRRRRRIDDDDFLVSDSDDGSSSEARAAAAGARPRGRRRRSSPLSDAEAVLEQRRDAARHGKRAKTASMEAAAPPGRAGAKAGAARRSGGSSRPHERRSVAAAALDVDDEEEGGAEAAAFVPTRRRRHATTAAASAPPSLPKTVVLDNESVGSAGALPPPTPVASAEAIATAQTERDLRVDIATARSKLPPALVTMAARLDWRANLTVVRFFNLSNRSSLFAPGCSVLTFDVETVPVLEAGGGTRVISYRVTSLELKVDGKWRLKRNKRSATRLP